MAKPLRNLIDNKNWYKDRYQQILIQRKILVLVTLFSLACTLATVITISQLTPLKTVEPYVIQVDAKSGLTQTVDPMNVRELTANEVVNNSHIVNYVRARENYFSSDLKRTYEQVRVMSAGGKVWQDYQWSVDPNNPLSNTARLGSGGTREIKISSIQYLNNKMVQLRVVAEEKAGNNITRIRKVILLAFDYTKMRLNAEERYINPLGFIVTEYRVSDEAFER